jgi:predicted DNA-binding transcriptional regulator AlpA
MELIADLSQKEIPMDSLLIEEAVSEKLQVSLACLRRWRLQGEGPKYVKMGPMVRYRPKDIEDWLGTLPTGGNGQRLAVQSVRRPKLAISA